MELLKLELPEKSISGRPLKINERSKREILREISRDPTPPMNNICKTLATHVSGTALRKFLREAGI
ncbi:hypothetical protein PHYBLDRAFT_158977 [Phycomyces blakesleeanus NRRL 1555(-)]|uniref:Homeodomain-like DNA binding domain-containing transcription factor n=1 Tax=Phycomyces blakesleeanus (strain ATCC 8743b / DSM 1359 / FGSC 10004 / NBRC 33097 / NRRL 1555) TaxID=763407 RepID=A0A162NB12_PHYB8|nr:hypothetical protein PHYBLDRAFT_158977 [Phycomyces blakesleeanus NRRL 1555(-)]OAD72738.1 hypothetical protein PHYBLDRAFT_158977 [Phycomyces blakesleeanus NRRL 1555(-)]|eukprot:XP_018290778.1 hypothetical protein PHYBLDRAFT_158977 [Phycomyces blakesleeanus NRRL 1555(-)]